jgi:transcriptional regulator with XRE-family HTH domain
VGKASRHHLNLLKAPSALVGLGGFLRSIRKRRRDDHPRGLALTEAASRTAVCGDRPVSASYWSRVERGMASPSAQRLLCMALAVEATPQEVRELFHLAGFGHLYDTLTGVSASPEPLVEGLLADVRIPYAKRRMLVEHLSDMLDAIELNRERSGR